MEFVSPPLATGGDDHQVFPDRAGVPRRGFYQIDHLSKFVEYPDERTDGHRGGREHGGDRCGCPRRAAGEDVVAPVRHRLHGGFRLRRERVRAHENVADEIEPIHLCGRQRQHRHVSVRFRTDVLEHHELVRFSGR